MKQKTALIIGAGPAGLTAAYELLLNSNIKPVIYEATNDTGGISKTVEYKGNLLDIGGHRFFSKSEKIMKWWQSLFPVKDLKDAKNLDNIFIIRKRFSRIYYLGELFLYPLNINLELIKKLGIYRSLKIVFSYMKKKIFPIKNVQNLEDFFINRFGNELYKIFFKDYTEKVWGISSREIAADWGEQRISNISISKVLYHALISIFKKNNGLDQKSIEKSLINYFLFPKYGAGQIWEYVAEQIINKGGEIHYSHKVTELWLEKNKINKVLINDIKNKKTIQISADYYISSMPIRDLVNGMSHVTESVKTISNGLKYRDLIIIGLLIRKFSMYTNGRIIDDNWIYVQDKKFSLCRLQIINNWSPYMVKVPGTIWLGLEYFCNKNDQLWQMSNQDLLKFAARELTGLGFITENDVLDGTIVKMEKCYPIYTGSYFQFSIIRDYLDSIPNLFLIGRNGMHKYNNMDHSMLSAMEAVTNIIENLDTKNNIWLVNTEKEHHES